MTLDEMGSLFEYNLTEREPVPVSSYIMYLNARLRPCQARIVGETSGVKVSAKGHVYFDLKDTKDESVINCAIWRSNYSISGIELKDGMEIVASGYPDIYAPSGRLTFKAATVEHVGEGALKAAYDKLKKKLSEEGLFAPERKRALPRYPERIGVITSKQGAVIHDFANNLGRHGYKITFMPASVEGKEAVPDLLNAIKSFRKYELDALVIMRGGGSLQSLQAFDNEALVREIVSFPVPVIAGIGHHRDVPLAALAADAAESTPTGVANLLNRSWEEAELAIERLERRILEGYGETLTEARGTLEIAASTLKEEFRKMSESYRDLEYTLVARFELIRHSIRAAENKLKEQWAMLIKQMLGSLSSLREHLSGMEKTINAASPERQLKLGYSITRAGNGKVVKSVKDVKIGEKLETKVWDGEIGSRVEEKGSGQSQITNDQ